MNTSSCNKSVKYAQALMRAGSMDELAFISANIRQEFINDPVFKKEFRDWLLDIHQSRVDTLKEMETPIEDTLNAEGLAAKKRGEI